MSEPTIAIHPIELLALKKLALICTALGQTIRDRRAAVEQRAMTKVLVEVIARADLANATAIAIARETAE